MQDPLNSTKAVETCIGNLPCVARNLKNQSSNLAQSLKYLMQFTWITLQPDFDQCLWIYIAHYFLLEPTENHYTMGCQV